MGLYFQFQLLVVLLCRFDLFSFENQFHFEVVNFVLEVIDNIIFLILSVLLNRLGGGIRDIPLETVYLLIQMEDLVLVLSLYALDFIVHHDVCLAFELDDTPLSFELNLLHLVVPIVFSDFLGVRLVFDVLFQLLDSLLSDKELVLELVVCVLMEFFEGGDLQNFFHHSFLGYTVFFRTGLLSG